MGKYIHHPICKVDQLGLGSEAMSLRDTGESYTKIATKLTKAAGIPITSDQVKTFINSANKKINDNAHLSQTVNAALKKTDMKLLDRWEKMDDAMMKILDSAQMIHTDMVKDYDKDTTKQIVRLENSIKLIQNLISETSKITEARARVKGQLHSGPSIQIINIENQYNDLKSLIIKAEDEFPGILDWLETKAKAVAD